MKRRSHRNNKYSKEMKLQAVKDYLNGEGSYDADLGTFDCHRNMTVEHFDPASVVVADRLFGRFGKIGVFGNERQHDSVNAEFRIDLLLHLIDRFRELRHSF